METKKLTEDDWNALLDDEKIPAQPKEQKKAELCMDDMIRDAVRGLSGYDGYLTGMVIRNVWQAKDLVLARMYLDMLIEEFKHD